MGNRERETDGEMVGERESGMERERWWVRGREGDGEGEMVGESDGEMVGERERGGWRGHSSSSWQCARSMFIFSFRSHETENSF